MSVQGDEHLMVSGSPVRQFARFAVPSVLGLISIASSGIVDGIFVGNFVGSDALAAVNLVGPMYALFFGVVVMLTVGAAVMAGKYLGEGQVRSASNIFVKAFLSALVFSLILSAALIAFTPQAADFLGANDEIAPLVETYLYTLSWFLPGLSVAVASSHFVRVDGSPNFALFGMVSITVVNIVLDALMIGVLDWGIWGAALATGLAFQAGVIVTIIYFATQKTQLTFIRPYGSWKGLFHAAYNGFSEFINESSGGVVMFFFNWILMLEVGPEGVAAFTIVNYFFFTGIMVFYGISEAMSPLVSVNYGARKARRINQFLSLGLGANFVIGLILAALLIFVPEILASLFVDDGADGTIALTVSIIAVLWPVFLFNGANIAFSGYFTGMHCARQSAAIALSRSLVLPLAFILLLWLFVGPMYVFIALPMAEVLTLCLSLMLFARQRPHLVIWRTRRNRSVAAE